MHGMYSVPVQDQISFLVSYIMWQSGHKEGSEDGIIVMKAVFKSPKQYVHNYVSICHIWSSRDTESWYLWLP